MEVVIVFFLCFKSSTWSKSPSPAPTWGRFPLSSGPLTGSVAGNVLGPDDPPRFTGGTDPPRFTGGTDTPKLTGGTAPPKLTGGTAPPPPPPIIPLLSTPPGCNTDGNPPSGVCGNWPGFNSDTPSVPNWAQSKCSRINGAISTRALQSMHMCAFWPIKFTSNTFMQKSKRKGMKGIGRGTHKG